MFAQQPRGVQLEPGVRHRKYQQRSSGSEPWGPHGPSGEVLPNGLAEGKEPSLRLSLRLLSASTVFGRVCAKAIGCAKVIGRARCPHEVHKPVHNYVSVEKKDFFLNKDFYTCEFTF